MLLTPSQQSRFWREWSAVCRLHQIDDAKEADAARKAMLDRLGFSSLKLVDRGRDFDLVLAELGRLRDHVARTAELTPAGEERGDRRRLLWLIRQHAKPLGGDPYILALARDRWHHVAGMSTIDDLTLDQLRQLMITLNARQRSKAFKQAAMFPETSADQAPAELPVGPAVCVGFDDPF